MWKDLASFKSLSDKKLSQPVSDTFANSFMIVTHKSTQKNFKKRCSMDEVHGHFLQFREISDLFLFRSWMCGQIVYIHSVHRLSCN